MAIEAGSVFRDRYRLDSYVAAGGSGEVWRGTDLVLKRTVAVKLLRPERASDADVLAKFGAEARLAGLLSHPHIAHVYDFRDADDCDPAYLVMEYVDGQSLSRLLDDGPLDPARTMDITAQAARGLAAAHRAGLVHRDIKPGNLLISQDGQVKVTDFGIAREQEDASSTQTGELPGTPGYMAPERSAGGQATASSDLYSLGVVAHQCLTGEAPFSGDALAVALAHMERDLPPLPPSVPGPVAALIADLTRKDPQQRPPSADAVAVRADRLRLRPAQEIDDGLEIPAEETTLPDLESVPAGDAAADGPPPDWRPSPDLARAGRRSRPGLWALASIVVLVLAAGGTAWLLRSGSSAPAAGPTATPTSTRAAARSAPAQVSPSFTGAGAVTTPPVTRSAAPASASPTPSPSPVPTATPAPTTLPPVTPTPSLPEESPTVSPSAGPTPRPSRLPHAPVNSGQ